MFALYLAAKLYCSKTPFCAQSLDFEHILALSWLAQPPVIT